MPHAELISTIAVSMALAFVAGFIAFKLNLSPIIGYLAAGMIIGPFTPGHVANTEIAAELSEVGIILLMFGVGLHFSFKDLWAVRKVAVPGAVLQILVASLLGAAVAIYWGWNPAASIVFGLSLSVASTVVLIKALDQRGIFESADGKIAVGWLIVEDLAMVLALVLLPALAPTGGSAGDSNAQLMSVLSSLLIAIAKVGIFVGLMMVIGRRLFPYLLDKVADTGSHELFTLLVIGGALGIAFFAAQLFDVSFALGAFFAGMVMSESDLTHRAAANALPFQEAFAVLFFVSVGMLFDPNILFTEPFKVLTVLFIILIAKSLAAAVLVLLLRYPMRTALIVSAALAQIGEFSFILALLATELRILPAEARSLIVAGALVSIALNPLIFVLFSKLEGKLKHLPALEKFRSSDELASLPQHRNTLTDHVVLIGYGRVGRAVADALTAQHIEFLVVEQNRQIVQELRKRRIHAIFGDAELPGVLHQTAIDSCRFVVVTAADAYEVRHICESAALLNPQVQIIVRTHSQSEEKLLLQKDQVDLVVVAEREIANAITERLMGSYAGSRR
jgi:CPA2 family monovalent cation:H+ antiporter-2